MLVSHLTFAQYPTTRVIKGDTVVIMTIKQASDINDRFDSYIDSISALKNKNVIVVKENKKLLDSLSNILSINESVIFKQDNDIKNLKFQNSYLTDQRKRDLKSFGIVALLSFILTSVAWLSK
jgi:hypothetical protein